MRIVVGVAYVLCGVSAFWMALALLALLGGALTQFLGITVFLVEEVTGWRLVGPDATIMFSSLTDHSRGLLDPAMTFGGYCLFAAVVVWVVASLLSGTVGRSQNE